ncbi:phosphatidate cytidylyltransferase [Fictibacillus sp. Mic-4]|uniref:phosphatidate cytidylyltransferase n=1 Tax=Fictibacillus TaxID=1329200 RepID=UPI000429D1C8|nr:phosphatidate cytidylyltransferase [Fictibacillus gelatini]
MKERIITGLIAAVLFIAVIIYGKLPFTIVVMLLAAVGIYELLKMKGIPHLSVQGAIAFLLTILIAMPNHWVHELFGFSFEKSDGVVLAVLLVLFATVITKNQFTFDDAGFIVLSALYVGYGFYYINATRMLEGGMHILFFVLFMIWATDSGAYFVGKAIGKRKLWPMISPNKTIEGSLGGIISSIVVGTIFNILGFVDYSYLSVILMAILVAVFGQIGDLCESAFKRVYGVKDSGNILPGHGGILDRCDSWLFAFPILHIFHLLS